LVGKRVSGGGNGARSGAQALGLLVGRTSIPILRGLDTGRKTLVALRYETGMPPQSTLRAQLKRLEGVEAIAKYRRNRFPGVLEYELTPAGRDLLAVGSWLERWLERAPERQLELGSSAARAATMALAEAWSTTMLRALAAGPLSLTELDRLIGTLSYPSLERRLAALRLAGQVEAQTGSNRGTPYGLTPWTREGAGPLVAAARWERRHAPRTTTPAGRIDAEAIFLLALPLLRLPGEISGSCMLAIELSDGDGERLTGVLVGVEGGRAASCPSHPEGKPDAWALSSPAGWLQAIVEADVDSVELRGDGQLAHALLDSLHCALSFRAPSLQD